jgi:hypothetical protein
MRAMRAGLLFLALLVSVAILSGTAAAQCAAAGDCPACKDIEGAPQAQMFLKMDSANYKLMGTFFYENTSDTANPRPPLADSTIIVEMFNDTMDKVYRTYTDKDGNAAFDFSAYAGGCVDFKVMYCPFTCADSSECGFQNCLNYSNIKYAPSCTAQAIDNAPDAKAPAAVKCYRVLPTMNTESYCPPPPPMSTVPAICLPLLLIFTLLGGGLFLSGKNPFGGFDFTAPRVGKHIRYEAKGRGLGVSAPSFVQQFVQGKASGLAEGGLKKAAGALGGMSGKGKGEKVTAMIGAAQEKRNAQQGTGAQATTVGGRVVMVGGSRGSSMKDLIMGRPVSPGSRFAAFGKLGGLVGRGAQAGYHLARGDTVAAKKAIMQSSVVAGAVSGWNNTVASSRAMSSNTGNAAMTPAAWTALRSMQLIAADVRSAQTTRAELGAKSQEVHVGLGKAEAESRKAAGAKKKAGAVEITSVERKTKNAKGEDIAPVFVVKMTVGGKEMVVTLDEASLRIGTFNGQIAIGNRTAVVEDGKIATVWTEITGKDRTAVTGKIDMNEVRAQLQTEGARADLNGDPPRSKSGETTITLANGEKITVKGDVAGVEGGKFSIVTSDNKIVVVEGGKIGSVGTSTYAGVVADSKYFAAATKDIDMGSITAALSGAVTMKSEFTAKEYGGAVVVTTNPLGPSDSYTVMRPASEGSKDGTEFVVEKGRVVAITEIKGDARAGSSIDPQTGIKVGSNEVGQLEQGVVITVADNAKRLGAANAEIMAGTQELARAAATADVEMKKGRVAEAFDRIEGIPSDVKDYLHEHPEEHARIIREADTGAVVSIARENHKDPDEVLEAYGKYEAARASGMEPEKAYEANLEKALGQPFVMFEDRYNHQVEAGTRVGYSHVVDKVKGTEDLSYEELEKIKAEVKGVAMEIRHTMATEAQSGARTDAEVQTRQIAQYAKGASESMASGKLPDAAGEVKKLDSIIANLSVPEESKAPGAGGGANAAKAAPARMAAGGGGGGEEPPAKPEPKAQEAPSEPQETAAEKAERAKKDEELEGLMKRAMAEARKKKREKES